MILFPYKIYVISSHFRNTKRKKLKLTIYNLSHTRSLSRTISEGRFNSKPFIYKNKYFRKQFFKNTGL